jgi:hypothetical protein
MENGPTIMATGNGRRIFIDKVCAIPGVSLYACTCGQYKAVFSLWYKKCLREENKAVNTGAVDD